MIIMWDEDNCFMIWDEDDSLWRFIADDGRAIGDVLFSPFSWWCKNLIADNNTLLELAGI